MSPLTWVLALQLAQPAAAERHMSRSPQTGLAQPNKAAKQVDAARGRALGMLWRKPVVALGFDRTVTESLGAPVLPTRHKLAVVGTGEGVVKAFHLKDGALAWQYDYGVGFEAAPTAVVSPSGEELIIIGALDGALLALAAATGELRWNSPIEALVRAAPTKVESALLVAAADNKVRLLRLDDGEIVWTQGRPAPSGLTIHGHARPIHVGGLVFAAFSDGYVEAYRIEDGSRVWARPLSITPGAEFRDADAGPLWVNGVLYVASYSDGIYALQPKTGQLLWQHAAPAVVTLVESAGNIVAGSADGWVWALEPKEGTQRFRTRMPGGSMSQIVADGGLLFFTAGLHGLVVLDARTGRPLQATALGARAASAPAWNGRELSLLTTSGYLYTFGLRSPGLVN